MQNATIAFIAVCLVGCVHDNTAQKTPAHQVSVIEHIDSTYRSDSLEVLDMDSVLLNHTIPFRSSIERITALLGKPDSIVPNTDDCGTYFDADSMRKFYFGRTWFEVNVDTAVIRDIDLTDVRFSLSADTVHLDGRTSMSDIARIFPKSASQAYPDPVDDGLGNEAMLVRLKPDPNYDDDWVLLFRKGQLVQIQYWIPC
ncbi:MAG: hypothetical protein ABI373_07355 [Flavobacteriales bacterium]